MDDHIAKPIDPLPLVATLNRWLSSTGEAEARVAALPAETVETAQLLDLKPFDSAAALLRVNGKKALLDKLIRDFAQTYRSVVGELRVQIATGLAPGARRLAHTLKGVAGSLELAELHKTAARIEMLLATGAIDEAMVGLTDLQAALGPAIEAAGRLDEQTGHGPATTVAPLAAVDPLMVVIARKTTA